MGPFSATMLVTDHVTRDCHCVREGGISSQSRGHILQPKTLGRIRERTPSEEYDRNHPDELASFDIARRSGFVFAYSFTSSANSTAFTL